MASKATYKTVDHDKIRHWIEARGGHPSTVIGTEKETETGVLEIDFEANGKEPNLREIDWDAFFKKFDEKGLAFLYQDETVEGKESRFFKFIRRDQEDREFIKTETEAQAMDGSLIRRLNDILEAELEVVDRFSSAIDQMEKEVSNEALGGYLREQRLVFEDQIIEIENLIYACGGEPTALPELSNT